MAYINCYNCGAQMSDKSEACPVCGTPVVGAMPPELPTEQNAQPKKPLNKRISLGIVGIVALIGIIIGIFFIAKSTGFNASIYKPLSESIIEKENNKYDDFSDFYSMLQQMTQASIEKGEQDKYKKITYKRITKYMYEVYSDLSIYAPSLTNSILDDEEYMNLAEPAFPEEEEYLMKRYEFQSAAIKSAHEQFDRQYREQILPLLNGKKQEWKDYIANHTISNYLIVTPKYDYKHEKSFYTYYRPSFYFDIKEPNGPLSNASVTFTIVDINNKAFSSPQTINLSSLKYNDGQDGRFYYFSKIDDHDFWKSHSIKLEINSISNEQVTVTNDDVNNIPELVRNYLTAPDYSNESQFIRQYVKADYPIYECFVEDFVLEQMKVKDSLCFEFLQTYSAYVVATRESQLSRCCNIVGEFYEFNNRYNYVTRRFANYTANHTDNYVYNNNNQFPMPYRVDVKPYSTVQNAYRIDFDGKYEDGYVVMRFENGKWKIDNAIIKTAKNPNYANTLAIDYANLSQVQQKKSQQIPTINQENQRVAKGAKSPKTEAPQEASTNQTKAVVADPADDPEVEEEEDAVFVVVEKMPEFPGGQQALFKYLSENVKYPKIAQENGIQGRVICQFVVNKDGSIIDVEVVRSGGDPSLDKEAVRVIKSMPKWKPGQQRGKPVRVKYTVPVNFKLQ